MMTDPYITHWSQAKTEDEEAEWWDKNATRLWMCGLCGRGVV
jgi:hypothetical protein